MTHSLPGRWGHERDPTGAKALMCRPTQTAPYANVPLTRQEIRIVIWSLKRAIAGLEMPHCEPGMTEEARWAIAHEKLRRIDGQRQVEEMVAYLIDCLQAMEPAALPARRPVP